MDSALKLWASSHQFSCSAEQAEDLKQAVNNLAVMCDDIKQQKVGLVESVLYCWPQLI